MKPITKVTLVALVTALVVGSQWGGLSAPAKADVVGGEELTFYMDHMRSLTHKLGLSIDAKNGPLASFYVGEVAEVVDLIKTKFPQYDGLQVGALITAMLSPQVAVVKQSVDKKDWVKASTDYDNMINTGCNTCHTAAQHPFIKIIRVKTNPFNQSFAP